MIEDKERLFYELIKEDYKKNNSFGYKSQMGVLVIKSLIPCEKYFGNRIDYERYKKELELWTYYKSNYNKSIINVSELDEDIYWNEVDDSIISRIIPIIVSNCDMEIIMDEIIKNILYTTGNLNSLFEYMMLGFLIKSAIKVKDVDKIINDMKEYIKSFKQENFLKEYKEYYRCDLNPYLKRFAVDFEREKIDIINVLNGIDTYGNEVLGESLAVLNGLNIDCETFEGNLFNRFLNNKELGMEIKIPSFYKNLGNYMMNLEKGRISAKDLYIDEYILPDVFKFKIGDSFYHTLLNESKVINKKENDVQISMLIRSKSGYYVFNKRK